MSEFPAITHVALTVSDLRRSRPWYQQLFGSDPAIDEDTGPFHHVVWLLGGTLVGIQVLSGIANGGIVDAPYGSGLSFRDPDNIALEFFAPPG